MPSPLREAVDQAVRNLRERLDEDLLPAIAAAASLSAAEIRAELDADGLVTARAPGADEAALRSTSARVTESASRRALVRGALAGAAGVLAVAPEAALAIVTSLHLAQRLCVVWGEDPDSETGGLLVRRALAAAYGLELPADGRIDLPLHELPRALRAPPASAPTALLVRGLGLRLAVTLGGRASRLIPGLGAGVSALQARRSLQAQGGRMVEVYRARWAAGVFTDPGSGEIVDAEELPPRAGPGRPAR